jgi:hypothetical protein
MADLIFTCYATLPAGDLRRLEVVASCDQDARRLAFESWPRALAVSCRAGAFMGERRHD